MPDTRPLRFRTLLTVFALALALRLVFCFWAVPRFDLANGPQTDEFFTYTDGYVDLAQNLVNHHRFAFAPDAASTTFRAPAFPFALAVLYWYLHDIAKAVLIVNCLTSAATTVLAVLIAQRLIPNLSRLATFSAALLPFSIWYCASSYSDTFLTFTVLLFVWGLLGLFAKPRLRSAVATGATFALTVLTKAILLPFPIVLVGYAGLRMWMSRRNRFTYGTGSDWTGGLLKACVASSIVGFLLIGIWTARNYRVSGHFVPVSQGMGFNLLAGTYMLEDWTDSKSSFQFGTKKAFAHLNETTGAGAGRREFRPEGHINLSVELDREFSRSAKELWRREPMTLVRKVCGNLLRFWYFTVSPERCALAAAMNFPLVALGLIGLIHYRRNNMAAFETLTLFMAFFVVVYCVIIVSGPRFCVPILMILAPFAGQVISNALRGEEAS